jgi:hypothetical protein
MPSNPYDQAGRYLARIDPLGLFAWLLSLPLDALRFVRWLDTRTLPFPGDPERTCDTVAFLIDQTTGEPWAVVLEIQITPDGLMFGRLLVYEGQLWLAMKPYPERGDRFNVGAVVLNLTGKGNSGRRMRWADAGLETALERPDRSLCEYRAEQVLAGVASGAITRAALGLIPLLQGGGEDGIIQRWMTIAGAEKDERRRNDHATLALIFAEPAGCRPAWKKALEGWNVIRSQAVDEWQAMANANMLIDQLNAKYGAIPDELAVRIRETKDPDRVRQWGLLVLRPISLDQFRQDTGLTT